MVRFSKAIVAAVLVSFVPSAFAGDDGAPLQVAPTIETNAPEAKVESEKTAPVIATGVPEADLIRAVNTISSHDTEIAKNSRAIRGALKQNGDDLKILLAWKRIVEAGGLAVTNDRANVIKERLDKLIRENGEAHEEFQADLDQIRGILVRQSKNFHFDVQTVGARLNCGLPIPGETQVCNLSASAGMGFGRQSGDTGMIYEATIRIANLAGGNLMATHYKVNHDSKVKWKDGMLLGGFTSAGGEVIKPFTGKAEIRGYKVGVGAGGFAAIKLGERDSKVHYLAVRLGFRYGQWGYRNGTARLIDGVLEFNFLTTKRDAPTVLDRDGDGYNEFEDCNDRNPNLNEVCDLVLPEQETETDSSVPKSTNE